MTFDYTGFLPMDEHGSRFVNRQRRDKYRLRYQVAGPWRPEGCEYDFRDCSFSWMKVLVMRRDQMLCQSCGMQTTLPHWNNRNPDQTRTEIQHIIPVTEFLNQMNREAKNQGSSVFVSRQSMQGQYAGICGHNLVTLCRRCHLKTFRMGYKGVPTIPSKGTTMEEFK